MFYQEAIERKEKRAQRFHFCAEESSSQQNVFLDKDTMKKGERADEWSPSVTRLFSSCLFNLSSSSVVLSYPQAAHGGHPHDGRGRHEHPGNL